MKASMTLGHTLGDQQSIAAVQHIKFYKVTVKHPLSSHGFGHLVTWASTNSFFGFFLETD
jgi:hypothetical protein